MSTCLPTRVHQNEITDSSVWRSEDLYLSQSWNVSLTQEQIDDLRKVGNKLRFQFHEIKKLNKQITPKEIIKARKEFRTSVIIRNIYSEVLNIVQAATMSKLSRKNYNKERKETG